MTTHQQIDFSTQETGPEDNTDTYKSRTTSDDLVHHKLPQRKLSNHKDLTVPEPQNNLNRPEDGKLPPANGVRPLGEGRQSLEENKNVQDKKLGERVNSNSSTENSKLPKGFIKLNHRGEKDLEPSKPWDEDLNWTFGSVKENFIGQFLCEDYKMTRGFLDGVGLQLRLYYTKLEPSGRKVASLCIVHGLGEHCGRYIEMADHFAKQGFVVHMIDLRGFGQSGYPRANSTAEEFHRDVEVLLKQADRALPLFIYAHSMGCALTSSLLIRNPHLNISGVIFTSGLFGFPKTRDMNLAKKFFVKALGDHLSEIIINVMINPTALSKNNYNVKKLFDDRLAIPIVGMRMAKTLVELTDYILPHAHKFNYPCLVIHGDTDTVTNMEDSVKFYKKASNEDKTLRIFKGGYHELQYDNDKELLKKIMSQWLVERVAKSPQNLGDIGTLRVGLVNKKVYRRVKLVLWLILALLYFLIQKKFRGHPLYSTSFRVLLYPLFYIKNVVSGLHGFKI